MNYYLVWSKQTGKLVVRGVAKGCAKAVSCRMALHTNPRLSVSPAESRPVPGMNSGYGSI